MVRRNFFRALIGAPMAAVAAKASGVPAKSNAGDVVITVSCDNSEALHAIDALNMRLEKTKELMAEIERLGDHKNTTVVFNGVTSAEDIARSIQAHLRGMPGRFAE